MQLEYWADRAHRYSATLTDRNQKLEDLGDQLADTLHLLVFLCDSSVQEFGHPWLFMVPTAGPQSGM